MVTFISLLILCYEFSDSKLIRSAATFYYIGSLIIGGGHVVVPMLLTEFLNLNWIKENLFWQGSF